MKKLLSNLLLTIALVTLVLVPFKAQAIESTPRKDTTSNMTKAICDLKMAERRLWIDHVSWTRSFIISDIASLKDKEDVLNRLLKNQDDIGNSIKPYYGEEAGNKLSALLREHIELAGKVLDAAKAKNKDDLEKYNKLWYENAAEIADFLSKANPNYKNEELKELLYGHLQFLTDQIVARLTNNWKEDIKAYDEGEDHIIKLADTLSDGIIKQFPEKFK